MIGQTGPDGASSSSPLTERVVTLALSFLSASTALSSAVLGSVSSAGNGRAIGGLACSRLRTIKRSLLPGLEANSVGRSRPGSAPQIVKVSPSNE